MHTATYLKNAVRLSLFFIIITFSLTAISAQVADVTAGTPATTPVAGTQNAGAGTSEPQEVVRMSTDDKVTIPSTSPASPYVKKEIPADIPRFETAPVIDGKLDDAVWRSSAVFGDFLQVNPGDNVAPTHPTEFMMGYDSKNLYMAYKIKQDPSTIRATVARRDNIFNDDYVLVYLDTFNDQRQAYVIVLNPLGIQADGTFTEGRGEDYSVDLVMESKGVLTEDGYTIEASIPFKSLRYEAGKNKKWGLHIYRRVKYKNGELNSWMPNNRSVNGSLNQAGKITGIEGVETTRQLELNPSITLSQTGRRTRFTFEPDPTRAGRFVNDGIKADLGFTAKFGLTPTTTLDFAYNPDFAQVEADAPISAANLRFPVFFPEKRPFFLERIDIFQSALNVVNTRAIVDPDIAAKLTGRRGKNTFGIMYASDNGTEGNLSKDDRQALALCLLEKQGKPNSEFCDNERIFGENADIGVFRLKRDIGSQHNLGFFATTYNFVDHHNNTAGFDARYKINKKTVSEFQILGTNTRQYFYNPTRDAFEYRTGNGVGYHAYLERSGKNLYMNYLAFGRSPDYRASVGFAERTDSNYAGSFVRYQTDQNPKGNIIYKSISNASNITYDWKGRMQYLFINTFGRMALQRQTLLHLSAQYGREGVYENEFGPIRTLVNPDGGAFFGSSNSRKADFLAGQFFIETTPYKQLFVFFFVDYTAGSMEYDFGAGPRFPRVSRAAIDFNSSKLDPGPGDLLTIESTIRYQPTTALQTQMNYTKRRMVRHDTNLLAFDDNLFSWRTVYQFSRNTFARLRTDFSTLDRRVRPQFVLGWTPSPGTALYLGYNDDVNYNGFNPLNRNFDQGRHSFERGIHSNGRTFFIKASYLFKRSF